MRFASTLSSLRVASVESTDSTIRPTIANFTTVGVGDIQIPKQRHALIANTAANTLLALTQFSNRYGTTASEFIDDTSRITVTVFTTGEIVETLFASVAQFSVKVGMAQALAIRVASNAH